MFKFVGKQGCGRSWLICTLLQFFPRNCFHAATTCRSLEMRRLRKSNLGAFSLFESCTEWRPACKTNFLPTAFDPRFVKPTQLGGGGKCKVGSRLEAGWAEAEGTSRQPEGEGGQTPLLQTFLLQRETLSYHLFHFKYFVLKRFLLETPPSLYRR